MHSLNNAKLNIELNKVLLPNYSMEEVFLEFNYSIFGIIKNSIFEY